MKSLFIPTIMAFLAACNGTSNKESELSSSSEEMTNMVDILVVVDNSGSMAEEQANLSTKLQPLLRHIQDSDWQIGIATTDPEDSCLHSLISGTDSDPAGRFEVAITEVGTSGSSNERGIQQAVRALNGECGNWVREGSALGVLIISDEDNCSDATQCDDDPWSQGSYLSDYMSAIREIVITARIYGLIWHPSMSQGECPSGFNQGHTYADLIATTGGRWGSICDDDYTAILEEISRDLAVIAQQNKVCDGFYFDINDVYDDACAIIIGDLDISYTQGVSNLRGLEKVRKVDGNIIIGSNDDLHDLSGLLSLKEVVGDFLIDGNQSLRTLASMPKIEKIAGNLWINNTGITSLNGLQTLREVGQLSLSSNQSLATLTGFEGVSVLDYSYISDNPRLCDLATFQTSEGKTLEDLSSGGFDEQNNCTQ